MKFGYGSKQSRVRRVISAMIAVIAAFAMLLSQAGIANAAVSGTAVRISAAVAVSTQPKSISARVGATATFKVVAKGSGTLKYQWQTLAPGSQTWKNSSSASAKKDTFEIVAQTGHHGYQFRCVVTDGNGSKTTSDAATLTVKPAITKQPKSAVVLAGATVKFTVAAEGKGELKYQWQTQAPDSTAWKNSTTASAKRPTFELTSKAAHNGYKFRCVVTDENGQKSGSETVTITIGLTSQPQDASVKIGSTAKFTVKAIGVGPLKYQWQVMNPATGKWSDSSSTSATTSTLSITTKVAHDGYRVRCIVTDGTGKSTKSSAAKLTVLPVVNAQPQEAAVNVGQNAMFTVRASGAGTLKYQWQSQAPNSTEWKNSAAAGSKTATLTVTTKEGHQGYRFRCVVTDGNENSVNSADAGISLGNIPIDTDHFPDRLFREYVSEKIDGDHNGKLSISEIAAVKTIYVAAEGDDIDGVWYDGIYDLPGGSTTDLESLEGIKYFTKLESLYCQSVVDDYVEYLIIKRNYISSLNLNCNRELRYLDCSANCLTQLDVSKNTKLETLRCSGMDPERYYNTMSFDASDAQQSYRLTALKVTALPNLKKLICSDNELRTLNLSKNTKLMYLDCSRNKYISQLDIANNPNLTVLICSFNRLTSLNLSKNTALKTLRCGYNSLATLNVSKCTALQVLDCSVNLLNTIDISKNTNLTEFGCAYIGKMPDISNHVKLTKLNCNGCNLTQLNVSKLTKLTDLSCAYNNLTKLDVSNNTKLEYLICDSNKLTSLNLKNNTALLWLDCMENNLTNLDLRKCTMLYYAVADSDVNVYYPENYYGY